MGTPRFTPELRNKRPSLAQAAQDSDGSVHYLPDSTSITYPFNSIRQGYEQPTIDAQSGARCRGCLLRKYRFFQSPIQY